MCFTCCWKTLLFSNNFQRENGEEDETTEDSEEQSEMSDDDDDDDAPLQCAQSWKTIPKPWKCCSWSKIFQTEENSIKSNIMFIEEFWIL